MCKTLPFCFGRLILPCAVALMSAAVSCGGEPPAAPITSPMATVSEATPTVPAPPRPPVSTTPILRASPSPTLQAGPPASASPAPFSRAAGTIPFQSLAQGYELLGVPSEPTMLLAADPATLETLSNLVDSRHRALLRNVDLEAEVALAAFWGLKPSGGFSITITGIRQDGGEVTVTVELGEVEREVGRVAAETVPYHLVTVERNALPGLHGRRYRLVSADGVLATGQLP